MTAAAARTSDLASALGRLTDRCDNAFEPLTAALGLQGEITAVLSLAHRSEPQRRQLARHQVRAHTLLTSLATHYGVKISSLGKGRSADSREACPIGALPGASTAPAARVDDAEMSHAIHQIAALACEYETGRVVPGAGCGESISTPLAVVDRALNQLRDAHGLSETNVTDELFNVFADYQVEGWSNPLGAFSAARFREVSVRSACPFAGAANTWGAERIPPDASLELHIHNHRESISAFVRAARTEQLDAYVFALPAELFGPNFDTTSETLARVLTSLSPPSAGGGFSAAVEDDGWRFVIDDEPMFVPVFSPLYAHDHPRYTHRGTDLIFIVLQPDSSFHRQLSRGSGFSRAAIRQRFAARLQPYDSSAREADKYLPLPTGCAVSPWYRRNVT